MRASATLTVPSTPDAVYTFLADLDNHWRLATSFVVLDRVEVDGGWITVRGPLGIRRRAHTSLVRTEPPSAAGGGRVEGIARARSGTVARVTWRVARDGESSLVTLETAVERPSRLDGIMLRLGGALWLHLCLKRTLAQLDSAVQRR